MPTYEYECEECGHNFEKFQSITADPIKRCPKCEGKVRRLIGAGAGVIFKGSGFYATDYRSESYKQKAKQEKGTEKISDTKSSDDKKSSDNKSSDSKDKS